MSGEIKLDTEKLAQSAANIQAELNQFQQFDKNYLTNTIDDLDKMYYSCSAKQLKTSLQEMGSIDLSIFAEKLDKYSQSSAFTGAEMERTDDELAKGYQGDEQNG